jgi:ABC-type transport system involved in multi-copper enzyme maturation permease subunit
VNRGIVLKSAREVLPVTLLLGVILLGVEAVLAYVLPTFARQFSQQIFRVPFVRSMLSAMLGTDLAEGIGPQMFAAMAWVHPVVLATIWAHAIIVCTRVPAGEVDRGTIDVLLALPVSRWKLYVSETLAWLCSAAVLVGFAVAGNMLGRSQVAAEAQFDPPGSHVFIVLVNLMVLYVAVGAAGWFFSALSDRRGRAMGIVFLIVVFSFLLNYLAQFWEPARRVAFLGVLRYYRPLFILRDGAWPLRDLAVLLGSAGVLWTVGGWIFARRDLSTL